MGDGENEVSRQARRCARHRALLPCPLRGCGFADLVRGAHTGAHCVHPQISELQNQIHHLARSNAELEAYLHEHGHDPELRAAIGENIVIERPPPPHTHL